MKGSRGKASVLSRQKPRRSGKGKRPKPGEVWRRLRAPLAFCVVLGLVYVAWQGATRQWRKLIADRRQPIDWKVDVRLDADNPLPPRTADDIARLAKDTLGRGEARALRELAAEIQRLDGFSTAHVLKVAPDRVTVSLKPRTPVMCVELDRLRLVSAEGDVYGVAGHDGAPACPGSRLVGLGNAPRRASGDGQPISLGDEERTAVHEALELVNEGHERGFSFSVIESRRFRGLSATVSGLETEVTLGRAPYGDKLTKLRTLVDKLTAKGEIAARIELDYQGKAFVKLKKL